MIFRTLRRLYGVIVWILLCQGGCSSQPQRRVALIIGNERYEQVSALAGPAQEARDLARKLTQELGFEKVYLRSNYGYKEMQAALRQFLDDLEKKPANVALLYYAGHGISTPGGENYLLPVDIPRKAAWPNLRWSDSAVSIDSAIKEISRRAGVSLLFFNNCLNQESESEFARGVRKTVLDKQYDENGYEIAESRPIPFLASYSTALGQFARAQVGASPVSAAQKYTPYGGAVLSHLGTAGVGIRDVQKRIRASVKAQTGGFQTPTLDDHLEADVYLNGRPPLYRRPWFWGVTGGVAVALVTSLIIGLTVGNPDRRTVIDCTSGICP